MLESPAFDAIPDEDMRGFAKTGLGFLAQSGVIQMQIQMETDRLLGGDADQPPKELAKAIKEYRRVTQGLMALQELGLQFYRESNNDEA